MEYRGIPVKNFNIEPLFTNRRYIQYNFFEWYYDPYGWGQTNPERIREDFWIDRSQKIDFLNLQWCSSF